MALTVAGKVIGLVLVVGAVVGGLYAYKTMMPPKAPVDQTVDVAPPPAQQPQETPTQPPVYTAAPATPEPVQQAPAVSQSDDASSNRGMQFLLNQGKK